MKKLLVCIAFHYSADRVKYLIQLLDNFSNNYKLDVTIYVDCNSTEIDYHEFDYYKSRFFLHDRLQHPFHLTWMHRKHIKHNIDNYDYFAYFEDDMLLPYENFKNYLENFELLWPDAVPSFIRVEEFEGEKYVSDVTERHLLKPIGCNGKQCFHALPFLQNYHAFWIMPQKQLKETMKPDFVNVTDGREFAAMYTGWELGKPCLVEIENGQVSPKCYSYHLPNTFATSKDSKLAKIKVNEIFI